jgi:hypothetical protein
VGDADGSLVVLSVAIAVGARVAEEVAGVVVVWRLLRVLRVLVRVLCLLLELVERKSGSSGFGRGRVDAVLRCDQQMGSFRVRFGSTTTPNALGRGTDFRGDNTTLL